MLYLLTRTVLAPVARLIYRPVIEGRENIPRKGPLLLASNHLSFIDSFVIPLVAPRRVVFLAKSEYFTAPGIRGLWMRWLFTAMGAVPVQRGTLGGAAQEGLDAALEVLKGGWRSASTPREHAPVMVACTAVAPASPGWR